MTGPDELVQLIKSKEYLSEKILVLGGGSNILVREAGVDDAAEDAGADALVTWGGGQLKASFNHRTYEEDGRITLLFDDALHPEQRRPLFDNRLQYDSDVGIVQADLWPDIDKNKTRLDLVFNDLGGFTVTGNGVWSTTENEYTNLQAD